MQVAEVVADEAGKQAWLLSHLPSFIDHGDVLVFAGQKARVDELTDKLKVLNFRCEESDAKAHHCQEGLRLQSALLQRSLV